VSRPGQDKADYGLPFFCAKVLPPGIAQTGKGGGKTLPLAAFLSVVTL